MGRPKGSTNKRTFKVANILEKQGINPLAEMAKMVQDPNVSDRVKADILKELGSYLYPKRKAIEVSGDQESPVQFQLVLTPNQKGQQQKQVNSGEKSNQAIPANTDESHESED